MYQVHPQDAVRELRFTRALGPRDELDGRQSVRTSTVQTLRVCPEPALSVTRVPGLALHGRSAALQETRGPCISFSAFWTIPAESHFGEMQSTSKLSQSAKMGKSRQRWANF